MHNFDPDHYGISATAMADVDWWLQRIATMTGNQRSDRLSSDEGPRRDSIATLARAERQRLKIEGPADLIAAVPYLLGFHPDPGSLVIIEFAELELTCALRTALDIPRAALAAVVSEMRSRGSDAAITITFSDSGSDQSREVLESVGIRIIERLRVHDGRWYSLDCQSPCCPPEGTPIAELTATTTALIAEGYQARPDRDAVVALLDPVAADVQGEIGDMVDQLQVERGPIRTQENAAFANGVVERLAAVDALPDRKLIAELAYSLEYNVARNWAIMQILNHRVQRPTDLWIWVMRHLRRDLRAPAATLAAYAAFQDGNALIAEECLDNALRADPGHHCAIVLYYAICAGVTPMQIREFSGYFL